MCVQLVDVRDEHVWDLGGRSVTQLLVDPSGFRFHAWSLDGDLQARFETPFAFRSADGHQSVVDPEQPRTLAPLLDLIQTGVSRILVRRTGEVEVSFLDGSAITAKPQPRL
jgi:Family of unknown function (DUF6188)